MTTITKVIGTSGDYSTITGWESDLDNTGIYTSGDVAVGQVKAQAFDEDVLINGGGTVGLTSITLQAYSGAENHGVPGVGARIVRSGASATSILEIGDCPSLIIEDLEVNGANQGAANGVLHSGANTLVIRRCLIHDVKYEGAADVNGFLDTGAGDTIITRCCVYSLSRSATNRNVYAIHDTSGGTRTFIANSNSVALITHGGTSGRGIYIGTDSANKYLQNNMSSAQNADYGGTFTTGTYDYNASTDATAPGAHSIHSVVAADTYTSLSGTIDLHLKSGAAIIDYGTNLGSTNGYDVDIDGVTVSGTWDIGADEYVSGGGGGFQSAWTRASNSII